MELPVNVIIPFPSGRYGFAGSVAAELAYVTKDGGKPTEKQMQDAKHVGPGMIGLKTRAWESMGDAIAEAVRLGQKVSFPIDPDAKESNHYLVTVIYEDKPSTHLYKNSGWSIDRMMAWVERKHLNSDDVTEVGVKKL